MTTEQLIEKVTQWATDRNIIQGCPAIKQAYKTLEECGELIEAVSAYQTSVELHKLFPEATDLSIPLHNIKDAIGDITVTLIIQCAMQGVDFVDCLEGAYNEIKDRRGKLINGQFIKEEYIPVSNGEIITDLCEYNSCDEFCIDGDNWKEVGSSHIGNIYSSVHHYPMRRKI